tara:strand:+ start:51093 stop:53123 length:2031 start_codon:yes stop_codon:yes gene_type:complete
MQFSRNWLKEFLDLKLDDKKICEQLTMLGLEVDSTEAYFSELTGKDLIIKLDLTPNRGDCFSVLGVARELAALNNLKLKLPRIKKIKNDFKSSMNIKVCPEGPIYKGRSVRNMDLKKDSLALIQERLTLSGLRIINPVVDITNYILLELGQPLHAFDEETLNGNIQVRLAKDKEKITLLDEETIRLSKDCLVIADSREPVALAGIMGGLDSAVTESTNSIFFESAFFHPKAIRGRARRYGFQTDASTRFERGVDYTLQDYALERACELLSKNQDAEYGQVLSSISSRDVPKKNQISFSLSYANKILGTKISKSNAKRIFNSLGFKVNQIGEDLNVVPPPWRFDLSISADLIEELARLEGYDKLPKEPILPKYHKVQSSLENYLRTYFKFKGYNEVINYSFVDSLDEDIFSESSKNLTVENPISQNLSVLRSSLISGLVNNYIYNQNNGEENLKLFEIGKVFLGGKERIKERSIISGLICGESSLPIWSTNDTRFNFYDLKGDLEGLFNSLGMKYKFKNKGPKFLHPGKSSSIYFSGKKIGYIGNVSPVLTAKKNIKEQDLIVFSMEVESLNFKAPAKFTNFSRFPSTSRDIAVLISKEISAQELVDYVKKCSGNNLQSLEIFDLYEGPGIPEGIKSMAISLTWQSKSKTLVDSEVDLIVNKIVNSLSDKFNAKLRS